MRSAGGTKERSPQRKLWGAIRIGQESPGGAARPCNNHWMDQAGITEAANEAIVLDGGACHPYGVFSKIDRPIPTVATVGYAISSLRDWELGTCDREQGIGGRGIGGL